jgi:type VI secretion system protein ImpK
MTEKDPFSAFESDRTIIIKPSAGRATRATMAVPGTEAPGTPLEGGRAAAAVDLPGFSPLLQAASPLLRAAPRIRAMAQHPNPAALRAALAEAVRQFETDARAAGVSNEHVVAGRYALCTLIDEFASSTPWGGSGAWSGQSLLVQFHNEAWGGEKVFQLLGKLAEDVPRHRDLLQLMYVVLALGFEGKYRIADNGRAQLDSVRERLAQMLRPPAGTVEKELSPHWAGVGRADARLARGIPVWVVAASVAFALMLLFVGLRFSIHGQTDGTYAALQALDVKAAPLPAPPQPMVLARTPPRLSGFLQPEIEAGRVEVRDLSDRSIITIRGDGFFEPGSAEVAERVKPLLGRIAEALSQVPGAVLVTGHTDNQPIRSVRYPSNWQLSQDRATAVRTLLATGVKPDRLKAEGRANAEPVDDNATPAGRARNRRVEIVLFV